MKLRPQILPLNSLRFVTRCILGLILIVLLQAGNGATPPATAAPDPTNDEGRTPNAGIAEALTNSDPTRRAHPLSGDPPSRRPQSVDSPSAQNVELIGQLDGTAHVVMAQGNYAYVTDGDGLRVIDVSAPTAPVEVGSHTTPGFAAKTYVSDSYAYLTDGALRVIDLSSPADPHEVGTYDTPGSSFGDVHIVGDYAYIIEMEGLHVIDVSDPTSPSKVGEISFESLCCAWDIFVAGNYAYVADFEMMLLGIIDVSDPSMPQEMESYSTAPTGGIGDTYILDDQAYITDSFYSDTGLLVLDLSDPTAPEELGGVNTNGEAKGVHVSGNYAYVADGDAGLRVIDVSDSTSPHEIGYYDTPGDAQSVFVAGINIYVADGDGGLLILRPTFTSSISGQVTDDAGNPLADATVSAVSSSTTVSTTTESDGTYTLADVPTGEYDVSATKAGYTSPPAQDVTVPPDATDVDFVLQRPTYAITGQVTDSAGNPLAEVTVTDDAGHTAITDSNGEYTLGGLVADTYTITPRKNGYSFSPASRNVAVPPDATGQDFAGELRVELMSQIGGVTEAVMVQGDYAYLGAGPRLSVLDISNRSSPTAVGRSDVMPGVLQDVQVTGNHAYVAAGDAGLRIVDVSDPTLPEIVGHYDTSGRADGVDVSGDYAYVAAGDLQVVDVSEPTAPQPMSSVDTPGAANGVDVMGDYAYVAGGGSLRVVEVIDPANPEELGTYNVSGDAVDVFVNGGHAYVTTGWAGDLSIIDVSDSTTPVEIGRYETSGYANSVHVIGDYAFVADGQSGGLRVVNVSDPASPQEVVIYDEWAEDVDVAGDHAYVALGTGGMSVVDVSDPASPAEAGGVDMLGEAIGIFLSQRYAYVTNWRSGLHIVDFPSPVAPAELSAYETPGDAIDVFVANHYAYVADAEGGLRVVDASDPTSPQAMGAYDSPQANQVSAVYVTDSYAYVADGYGGLRVVDISDPAVPAEVGFLETAGYAQGVHVAGNYAYVVDRAISSSLEVSEVQGTAGLRIVEISDPATPQETGFYEAPPGGFSGVHVNDGHAYVTDGQAMRVIDISDPASPDEIGHIYTPNAQDAYAAGNYAYVTDGIEGVQVIDISDPAAPQKVGHYDTPGFAHDIYAACGDIFVADRSGLFVLRLTGSLTCYDFVPNGQVDAADIQAIVAHWGDPDQYDPQYDVAPDPPDGVINILDIMHVAAAWGPYPTN